MFARRKETSASASSCAMTCREAIWVRLNQILTKHVFGPLGSYLDVQGREPLFHLGRGGSWSTVDLELFPKARKSQDSSELYVMAGQPAGVGDPKRVGGVPLQFSPRRGFRAPTGSLKRNLSHFGTRAGTAEDLPDRLARECRPVTLLGEPASAAISSERHQTDGM
jgi:hypothetical protein